MGNLHLLPRGKPVAQQGGRNPAPTTDLRADARQPATLVPGREAHRFGADFPGASIGRNYVISADGGTPQELPSADKTQGDPNWSPDGNSIVFWSSPAFPASPIIRVNIVDLRTRGVSTVAASDGIFSPHWSPDGHYLAAIRHGAQALMLFDFQNQKWLELA